MKKEELILQEKTKIKLKRVKEKTNNFFNSIFFAIFICVLIVLKTIFFYYDTIIIREQLNYDIVIGTMTFVAILLFICLALPNKTRFYTTFIADIFISVLLLGDDLYYSYSSSVLSIFQITNLQYGEEIISTLPMIMDLRHILYFVDIVIIFILLLSKYIKIEKAEKATKKQKILRILSCVVAITYCFVGNKYTVRALENPYNKDLQIKTATIYGYHIADIQNALQIKKQAKYSNKEDMEIAYNELKNDYNTNYGESNYYLESSMKGKNVIILQLESIQEFVLHKSINGKEITPNLNKFLDENIEFSNMYMQSYSSTADSEFSTISSLYPMENGMSFSKYYTNSIDDIFSMFHQDNYTTSYMHGNYGYFWNRGNVYSLLPVDHLELKDAFKDTSENIMGYLSDELLYNQAVEKIKNYNKPFFTYIVSASSHTAFTLDGLQDTSKVQIDVGKYKGTFFGNYLESVNYADYAFGKFIEELKAEDLYDDAVILIYGDHNGLEMYNEEMIDYLKQSNPDLNDIGIRLNYIKVACSMKIPGIEHLKIEKPVSKLDIKPTFAYLYNLDDGVSLGTNMFARKDFISLNNERIVSSRYYYDGNWFEISTGNLVDFNMLSDDEKGLLNKYEENMRKELDISKSINIHNLLK